MITTLLVDDHSILRQGLRLLLSEDPELMVIGEASNGEEAIKLISISLPDVVLLDIAMPVMNGLQTTRKIHEYYPQIKILILTQYDSQDYLFSSLEAGGSGYVLKSAVNSELILAIKTVINGGVYLSPSLTKDLLQDQLTTISSKGKMGPILTPREEEVLTLLAEGHSNREIASKLMISIKTVESHRAHIMEKLNFGNLSELIKYAVRKGFITV